MTPKSNTLLTINRRFAANRLTVFAALTQVEAIRHWMCPADFTIVNAESDPKTGGRFSVTMQSPEGEVFETGGTYLSIRAPEYLEFTWQWARGHTMAGVETVVTIKLTANGDDTEMEMHHYGLVSEEERDNHEYGWTGAFTNLENYLANHRSASR